MSHSSVFFGYRKDITPFPIKRMEDLLDPQLKGKVIVRDATGVNNKIVMFALAFGGNERNMEPGWAFLKKLAESGNIGRAGKTEVDFINAMTSGEVSVGFWNIGAWGKVAESFPCEFLLKSKSEAPGFQAGTFTEGFMIPKELDPQEGDQGVYQLLHRAGELHALQPAREHGADQRQVGVDPAREGRHVQDQGGAGAVHAPVRLRVPLATRERDGGAEREIVSLLRWSATPLP